MSWDDKHRNVTKHSEIPEIPRHQKKAPKKKRYGIEYFSRWFGTWHNHTWYATAKARDQAFEDINSKTGTISSEARKVER